MDLNPKPQRTPPHRGRRHERPSSQIVKLGMVLGTFIALCAAPQAGMLVQGSEQWQTPPGPNAFWTIWGGGANDNVVISHNLTLGLDATQDHLVVTGQTTYTVTIASANVQEVVLYQDLWRALADVDPNFSGPVLQVTSASGFAVGTPGFDYTMGYTTDPHSGITWIGGVGDNMGHGAETYVELHLGGRDPVAGSSTQNGNAGWQLNGSQANFNLSASAATTLAAGNTNQVSIGTWLYQDVFLRPAANQPFFATGTYTFTIDLPVSSGLAPVPEPATLTTLGIAAVGLLLRRNSRKPG